MSRTELTQTLEAAAGGLIVWPACLVVLACGTAFIGLPVSGWLLVPSAAIALGYAGWMTPIPASRLSGLVVALVSVAAAYGIASTTYDGSYDGLWYHQEAILRLAAGWIPLRESALRLGDGDQIPWLDHYPKAAWIAGAAILDACGRIESAKLFNVTLMVAAAAQTAACLLHVTAWPTSRTLLVGVLIAVNPVALYQSTSFYLDGWLASCLTVACAAAVAYVVTMRWSLLGVAAAACLLLINLKFTGLMYWAFFIIAIVAGAYWCGARRAGARLAWAMLLAGAFGVAIVGYNPYLVNLRAHGHIFFPVVGNEGIEPTMMANNLPPNLRARDRLSRFVMANGAVSNGEYPPPNADLKWPFALYRSELQAWRKYDVRIGGFGPLFSAMLLLAVLLAGPCARWRGAETRLYLAGAAVVLASVFLHSEGWWARYAPQAWIAPLLIAAAATGTPHRALRVGGRALIAVAVVNVLIVGGAYGYGQAQYAASVRESLEEMRAAPQPIDFWPGRFASLRERLREAGVTFTSGAPSPDLRDTHTIPSTAPDEARWR